MKRVTVLGARSFAAKPLIAKLLEEYEVWAVSRQPEQLEHNAHPHYKKTRLAHLEQAPLKTDYLVSLLPLWEAVQLIPQLVLGGLKKAVLLSSSSVMNKQASKYRADQVLVERLKKAEDDLEAYFEARALPFLILRSTMLFGYGQDQNLSLILKILRRFHIMPLLGQAQGLRQPLHADDLAEAICLGLLNPLSGERLSLGGASQLSYRQMVDELAQVAKIPYRALPLPRFFLSLGLSLVRLLPAYRFIDMAMFERMTEDLIVDNTAAEKLLGYRAVSFQEALARDFPKS